MQPLAERMRPTSLEDYIGQEKVIGPQAPLRKAIDAGHLPSCILWGPPGVGKTTLASLLAGALKRTMYTLSAVQSGVKEVREALEMAKKNRMFEAQSPILFIDEIHRFSKSQQDSLLNAVEKGIVTLVGATTENPSFEVISALLSRCQVYVLESLGPEHLQRMLEKAIANDPLGGDLEGLVRTADGSIWMCDEYRPALYKFDATGLMLDRFVPAGSNAFGVTVGTEAFPAVYAQRRDNRGFEAIAVWNQFVYCFVQSPLDNPDVANDANSKASRNIFTRSAGTPGDVAIGRPSAVGAEMSRKTARSASLCASSIINGTFGRSGARFSPIWTRI